MLSTVVWSAVNAAQAPSRVQALYAVWPLVFLGFMGVVFVLWRVTLPPTLELVDGQIRLYAWPFPARTVHRSRLVSVRIAEGVLGKEIVFLDSNGSAFHLVLEWHSRGIRRGSRTYDIGEAQAFAERSGIPYLGVTEE